MPRTPRLDIPHLLHHVIIRGIERCDIFRDEEDRRRFLSRLALLLRETSTHCYAWALMRNHVHLLLMPTNTPLSSLMRRLLTSYAVVYNRKYNRSGHLFQNRYKSILCEDEPYFLELVRYIHLNPVRAGAVATVEALADYPWSGHAVVMGEQEFQQDVVAVLERFGTSAAAAREAYLRFVADGVELGRQEKLVGGGLRRSQPEAVEGGDEIVSFDARILGGGGFVEQIQARIDDPTQCQLKIPLPEVVRKLAEFFQVDQATLLRPTKIRHLAEIRGIICYYAVRELGYKGIEVGRYLHLGPTGVTLAARRGEQVMLNNPELVEILRGVNKNR